MGLRISIGGRVRLSVGPSVRPSVRLSVRPSVPCYFRMRNIAIFECKNSSNDIIIDGTMSDDKVVASDVPQRYLLSSEKTRCEEKTGLVRTATAVIRSTLHVMRTTVERGSLRFLNPKYKLICFKNKK